MILYTKPLTLQDYDSVTVTGVTDDAQYQRMLDGDRFTDTLLPNATTTIKISYPVAVTIDSIWVKGSNLKNYNVDSSTDDSTWINRLASKAVPSNGIAYDEFTRTSARYWRVQFTGRAVGDPAYRCAEIYLLSKLLDMNNDRARVSEYRAPRQKGLFSRAEKGNLIFVQPKGWGLGKARLRIGWDNLPLSYVRALRSVWQARVPFESQFTVYPLPAEEPKNIFVCEWIEGFQFKPAGPDELGQQGSITFQEL